MENTQSIRPTNATAVAGQRGPGGHGVSPCRRLGRLLVFVLPLLVPAGVLARYANSPVANPIGPANVPPSSYQSSAVRTPGATSDTGNLLVTGNVSGAKQFRAPVPYQSPTRFQGTLGSTSLDSFLRASAAPQAGGYSRPYGAFYSPTGTVAKIGAGQAADSAPLMQASAMKATPVAQPQAAPATPVKDWRMWEQLGSRSASGPSLQKWKALSSDPAPAPADRRVSQPQRETVIPENTFRQLESTWTNRPVPTLPSEPAAGQTFLKPSEASRSSDGVAASRPQALAIGPRDSGKATTNGPWDMEMRGWETVDSRNAIRSTDKVSSAIGDELGLTGVTRPNEIDGVFPPEAPKPGVASEAKTSSAVSSLQRAERTAREFDAPSNLLQRSSDERAGWSLPATSAPANSAPGTLNSYRSANGITWVGRSNDGPAPRRADPSSAAGGDPRVRTPDAFARGLRTHATTSDSRVAPSTGIDPLSEIRNRQPGTDDFERHMHAARSFVQQGRYYRAAESFTRASAYQPSNAIPHLGRSIALFAAGEYITSSLCLARALELNPQSALMQARIVNAAGGPARFEQRLADLEQCLKDSDAPQLHFLLAYVYHHIGRAQEAARAVEAARRAMPSSAAVDVLKAAIAP